MNIKQEIGKRIAISRKAAGLTIKELADMTRSLKAARIGNWEQGTRSPGPTEALQLAEALKVDPAYLLCLSNIKNPYQYFEKKFIPILSLSEAIHFKEHIGKNFLENIENVDHLVLDQSGKSPAFAIKIDDQSMSSEFAVGDIVIIDTQKKPSPGNYVLVQLKDHDKVLLRKYRLLKGDATQKQSSFELIPLNPDWPILVVKDSKNCRILGVCVEHRRYSD